MRESVTVPAYGLKDNAEKSLKIYFFRILLDLKFQENEKKNIHIRCQKVRNHETSLCTVDERHAATVSFCRVHLNKFSGTS